MSEEMQVTGRDPLERGSRRGLVIVALVAIVVALLGGGAYAAYQYLNGGGPRPEEALPATTVVVASIDLDPKAGQKIEAIKTLRKFPALRRTLGIESQDDLRRFVYDKAVEDGACAGIDYDRDIDPWIGKRAAFAAVDLGDELPAPALVLQVSDVEKARIGFAKVADCIDEDEFAFVIGEDYLIASDSEEHAQEILTEGERNPLTEDEDHIRWVDEVGGQGILNFYVAPRAGRYIADVIESFADGSGLLPGTGDPDSADALRTGLEEFAGLAGTVRFADGGVELVIAGGGKHELFDEPASGVGDEVGDLPADTALVLGLAIPDGFVAELIDHAEKEFGAEAEDLLDEMQTETGLDLPEDAETLLGRAVTLSVGGDAPADLDDLRGPEDLPVGLVLHGDGDKARAVISKVEENLGADLSEIPLFAEVDGDKLALSPSEDYAKDLVSNGGLGDEDAFRSAVPDADDADGIFFVSLDRDWRQTIVDLVAGEFGNADAAEIEENLEPLRALGISVRSDGASATVRVRLSTR